MLNTEQKGLISKMTLIGAIVSAVLWILTFVIGYGTPSFRYVEITVFFGVLATISTGITFKLGYTLFTAIMKELK